MDRESTDWDDWDSEDSQWASKKMLCPDCRQGIEVTLELVERWTVE